MAAENRKNFIAPKPAEFRDTAGGRKSAHVQRACPALVRRPASRFAPAFVAKISVAAGRVQRVTSLGERRKSCKQFSRDNCACIEEGSESGTRNRKSGKYTFLDER